MVKDYKTYSKTRHITFIGVNMTRTGDVRSVGAQVKRYKLEPFANMIDAGGATASAYNVPVNAPNWLTVIDSNGKIVYNATKGWHWSSGPNKGKYVHHTQMEASLKKAKGILQFYELPSSLEKAAHLYDLQQFHLVQPELKIARRKDKSEIVEEVSKVMDDHIRNHGKTRLAQIKKLAETNPVQAYREASSFLKAYPRFKEAAEIRKLAKELTKAKSVKRELYAESVYKRLVVPALKKCRDPRSFDRKVAPLMLQYMKVYGKTEFSSIAKKAVDAHEAAVQRAR